MICKIKNRFIGVIVICLFLNSCLYDSVTHLSEDELGCIDGVEDGDTFIYDAEGVGSCDTIVIRELFFRNKEPIFGEYLFANPFYYFEVNSTYEAYVLCNFEFCRNNVNYSSSMHIRKPNGCPNIINWYMRLGGMWKDNIVIDSKIEDYVFENDSSLSRNENIPYPRELTRLTLKKGRFIDSYVISDSILYVRRD